MKNIKNILIRLVMLACTALSFCLLLNSVVSLKIDNTRTMGKEIIEKVVNDSNNQNLKLGVQLLQDTGVEASLLKQLPKKYKLELSYADLYSLCGTYNEKGKITVKDLGLTSKTKLEEIINQYLVKQINYRLKQDAENVSHMITIYRYSILLVGLLFVLAAILIILGRFSASLPLIVATLISFAVLWLFSNEATAILQEQVYRGITVELSTGIWWGAAIGVVAAIAWPLLLKLVKGKKK